MNELELLNDSPLGSTVIIKVELAEHSLLTGENG